MRQRPRLLALATAALVGIAAGACGSSGSGQISIDGSSTVYPISQAVAEEFTNEFSGTGVNVGISGTGGGFEKFCRGEIEISDASRPMREDEEKACEDRGFDDIVGLTVALDALTVVVNPDNGFLECLTVEQLHQIFKGGGATRWNQVDPSFPDRPIHTYYPGTDSGTFDYFEETVIRGVDESASHRGDGTSSEDDNVLAQGIENDPDAIGYLGFAYYQEAGGNLKAVGIDGGAGCVEPTYENALEGRYEPLSRPLFIYTLGSLLEDPDNDLYKFVEFYLDNSQALAREVGYVALPDEVLDEQYAKIEPFRPPSQESAGP